VLWALGEKLNYINMIAFPVILGIGVDDGVHFMHRFMQEGQGGLRKALASVGQAMVMSSLTTMIGFGSLMFYLMVGMASMGLVLFIGVGACLLVTLLLMPALATIFGNRLLKESSGGASMDRAASLVLVLVALLGIGAGTTPVAAGQDAAEILEHCDDAEGYDSSYGEMKQVITTTSGNQRTLAIRSWAVDSGDRQLAEYLAPADVEGQRMLMTNDGDDIWMFNAETRRTRKLGSHMRKKKVMGSDFTYEDQAGGKISKKYSGRVLREEEMNGVPCFVLELEPTPEGPSYRKIVLWLGMEDYVTRRVDYYQDEEPEPFKRLVCEDLRDVEGKVVPFTMTMTNLQDDTETINIIDNIAFGVEIPDAVFDPRNLGR
jgi:outer membrane lipoprotein-sorting protein